MWLAPYTKGLECYSLEDEGKLLHHYTTDNSLLSHNSVTDVKEFGSQLWIATDGGGINILDRKSGFFNMSRILHLMSILSLPILSVCSLKIVLAPSGPVLYIMG